METYGVYVKVDESGRIIAVNSSAFLEKTDGWTKIDEGCGDRFHHAQSHYFPMTIVDDRDIWRYKMEGGKAMERSQEDMDVDYVEPVQEQDTQELLLEMAADHEYRLCLMELGVSEDDL